MSRGSRGGLGWSLSGGWSWTLFRNWSLMLDRSRGLEVAATKTDKGLVLEWGGREGAGAETEVA